jgi:VanZ family protein
MTPSELKQKPKNRGRVIAAFLAVIWAAVIFCISSIPGSGFPGHPDILNTVAHFIEYALLAVLLTLALNSPKRALWITALVALIIASLYGASDELHQLLGNNGRFADPLDWLTDTIGALVGAFGTIWFISAQKVKQSRKRDGEN